MANKTTADLINEAGYTGKEVTFEYNGVTYDFSPEGLRNYILSFISDPIEAGTMTFAALGDSMTFQNMIDNQPPNAFPARVWMSDGFITWFRRLTNQRIDFPIQNVFGVSGNTLQQMHDRVPLVIASGAKFCTLLGATNNFPGDSFATIVAAWLAIVDDLVEAGITPVILPCPPRIDGVLTAAQQKTQQRFYAYQKEYAKKHPKVMFVDYTGYIVDQTNAAYVPLPNMLRADNVHPAQLCAFYMGKALADAFATRLIGGNNAIPSTDVYDAVNNPTGSLMHSGSTSHSLFNGTGGIVTPNAGLTYSNSNLADGFIFFREAATSTATVSLTKENPRTDTGQASGVRQVIEITANSGGGADEVYNLRYDLILDDTQPGDWYYGEVSVELTEVPVNVNTLEFYLLEARPANSQIATDGYWLGTVSRTMPSVAWKGKFRTPPIRRQSDTTYIQVMTRARLNASSSTASIKMKLSDIVARKIDPTFV